jgi:acid phosphatase (class A)
MRQRVAIAFILLALSTVTARSNDGEPSEHMSGAIVTKRTPYFVDPSILDLSQIFLLPPAQESETTKGELAYIHRVELTRTPEQVAAAQADDREEDLFIFKQVIGPQFNKEHLPLTSVLSAHLQNDEAVISEPLKAIYKRPRPYNYVNSGTTGTGTARELQFAARLTF